jgi:hypothetical protein
MKGRYSIRVDLAGDGDGTLAALKLSGVARSALRSTAFHDQARRPAVAFGHTTRLYAQTPLMRADIRPSATPRSSYKASDLQGIWRNGGAAAHNSGR